MAMLWTALVTVSLPSAVALTSTATCQHATGECYNNPGKAHHISTTLSNRSACACAAKCVGAARCVSWTNWQPTTPQCGNTGAEFCCRLYSSNGTLVTCPGAGAKSASGWFGTPPPPAPPPVPPPKGAPNILFIAVDDLRPQLGAYGHRDTITPNMDMLASRGLLFLNAHAQIAHCSPSRNSLLSGRAPDRVKVWNFIDDFREAGDGVGGPSIVSLPQYFKQHGYRTSGTGKIFHPGKPANNDMAYSWSVPYGNNQNGICRSFCNAALATSCKNASLAPSSAPNSCLYGKLCPRCKCEHPSNYACSSNDDGFDYADDAVANYTVSQLELLVAGGKVASKGKPFFVAAGIHKPHLPYFFKPKHAKMYPPEKDVAVPPPEALAVPKGMPPVAWMACMGIQGEERNFADFNALNITQSDGLKGQAPLELVKNITRGYMACASYVDDQVGLMLGALQRLGLVDDTIVVLWGDHGQNLGEHNTYCKMTLFESSTRVPLIISSPLPRHAKSRGQKTNQPAQLLDLYPTLLSLAGLPLAAAGQLDGVDLSALLAEPAATNVSEGAFSQQARCYQKNASTPHPTPLQLRRLTMMTCEFVPRNAMNFMGYSIRTTDWRFTSWVSWNGTGQSPLWDESAGDELYDHRVSTMPSHGHEGWRENVNLVDQPEHAATTKRLRVLLQAHFKQLKSDDGAGAATPCHADERCLQPGAAADPGRGAALRCLPDVPGGAPCVTDHSPRNSTCACGTMLCNGTVAAAKQPGKKQLLIIGDSISLGWMPRLDLPAAAWQVVHAGTNHPGVVGPNGSPENNANTNWIDRCGRGWLTTDPQRWDVILLNAGLHDLAVDSQHVNVSTYGALLGKILATLQKSTRARIVWLTSTPAPTEPPAELFPVRTQAAVLVYNAAAAAAVAKFPAVRSCDLFGAVCSACAAADPARCEYSTCPLQIPSGIHYEAAGWKALGATVASCVQKHWLKSDDGASATAAPACRPPHDKSAWCNPLLTTQARIAALADAVFDAGAAPALLSNGDFGPPPGIPSLGLPSFNFANEACHGLLWCGMCSIPCSEGASCCSEACCGSPTVFPQVITLAASLNRSLWAAVGAAISTEARAFDNVRPAKYTAAGHSGALNFWAPNMNLLRDPRWGRGQETPGEDPGINGDFASHFVRGMQGEDERQRWGLKVGATCKHAFGYSLEGRGAQSRTGVKDRHHFNAVIPERDLADSYLPPFRDCVQRGNVSSLMCSYNAVNGVPACADKVLLTDTTRTKWKWDGLWVSDCGAVQDVYNTHNYTKTAAAAVAATLDAGLDLNCGNVMQNNLNATLASGQVTATRVKESLKRQFAVRFALGEFDDYKTQPYRDAKSYGKEQLSHASLALDAAKESLVLLKNDQNMLPLWHKRKLALIGFGVDKHNRFQGSYAGNAQSAPHLSAALGLRAAEVRQANGTSHLCGGGGDDPAFAAAEAAAKWADAVVVVVGTDGETLPGGSTIGNGTVECDAGDCLENEGCDRLSLALPAAQRILVAKLIAATSARTPLVLLVISGGAVDLGWAKTELRISAMIWAGFPGEQHAEAIAATLFGENNPSGRLTQTFYSDTFTAELPVTDMGMRPTATTPGRGYRFYTGKSVVYPFGTGVSFSSFVYSDLQADAGGANASITVKNTAGPAGALSVLAFLSPPAALVAAGAPLRLLAAYEKIRLGAGESRRVALSYRERALYLAQEDGSDALGVGRWSVEVGGQTGSFDVAKPLVKTDDDGEPNPPQWPSTVHVFGPGSADTNATIQSIYQRQRADLYTAGRVALLFKPGVYDVDVPVGYYTTVHGLGQKPEDVSFVGKHGVHQAEPGRNLIQFWRSAENLANRPASREVVWSVSQASPLRRMVVDGDLVLGTAADTQGSGGFVSGVKIKGQLNFTMQQQWIARNCEVGARGISYFEDPPRSVNFVFVGTRGSPQPTTKCTNSATNPVSPEPQKLVVESTPLIAEKPYIRVSTSESGKYELVTPKTIANSSGVQWDAAGEWVDGFEKVFVASNTTAVAKINAKLAQGLHVILTPGVYELPEPIRIGRGRGDDEGGGYQVLLGLGLATLIPLGGGAAIEVADVPGVRVVGILLQAGPLTSKALISVGAATTTTGSHHRDGGCGGATLEEPILLADVFARVGGPDVDPETGIGPAVSANLMMEINASNVLLDNVWLWRADVQNGLRVRDCNHSLVVNGHNVTAYGLAAEHTQSDNTIWNGEHGQVFFYQAELDGLAHKPGDKTPNFGPNGVSGYRVNAMHHSAMGVGVYCWFSSPGIVVESAVKVLHQQTEAGIVCPFQWVWENANTPPEGNSTIEQAILAVKRDVAEPLAKTDDDGDGSGSGIDLCVIPPTRHLNYSDSCASHKDIASKAVSWAAQRGEFESMQLLLSTPPAGKLSVVFSDLKTSSGLVLPKKRLSFRQQGYVKVRHTARYADSGCPGNRSCWRPDPLFEPAADNSIMLTHPQQLAGGKPVSQSIWLTIEVPVDTKPAPQGAEYMGKMELKISAADGSVRTATVQISLEVWNVKVSTTKTASLQNDWGFNIAGRSWISGKPRGFNILSGYPKKTPAEIKATWWGFMQKYRLPPANDPLAWKDPAQSTQFLTGKSKIVQTSLISTDCNCSSCPLAAAKANALAMKADVEAARKIGSAKLYAYGFDERPPSCEKSIRTAFGAFYAQFPLKDFPWVGGTMGALNWPGQNSSMPLDMPYTDWVLQYQYYNDETAKAWVASKYQGRERQLWLYHCIEPSKVNFLNIFIERPLIHARLLFWLGSTQRIQGWLYWTTDLWENCPTAPKTLPSGENIEWQRKPVTYMERPNGTFISDFEPGSVIWCSTLPQFWVNGDGYYMYPGADGPISTSRLESIRDALEDLELFRTLPEKVRNAAVKKLVRNATDWTDDPALLEKVRRKLGRQAEAMAW